ncbi:MAG TPA: hypothetical protein EYG94_07865 [Campylobacterales bacterium]|nr:hypothetical protein [Campylobacterales bacterium]
MSKHLKVFIILLILLTIYIVIELSSSIEAPSEAPSSKETLKTKSIQIEPIKIVPIQLTIENSVEKKTPSTLPLDILSKLKTATKQSKEAVKPSKEEESKNILLSLKKKAEEQKIKEVLVQKLEVQKIPKKIKPKKPKVIKTKVVLKKVILKKEAKAKVSASIKIPKPKKETLPIKIKNLSREKEVELYNRQYGNTLEVVNISDSFEIKEENILPDSHYFEPIKEQKILKKNTPLKFVEKLGVVIVSDKYESNFTVPQKVEIAKEGIVNFSHTSTNTKELQKLEFVDTLGVLEISEDFETINAKKYLD